MNEKNNKTIFVTGGAGFIGSNFIEILNRYYPKYHVVCYDNLSYAGNLKYLDLSASNSDKLEFIKGDITSRETLRAALKAYSPDYIVNFAAQSHVDKSIKAAEIFCKTNIQGTVVLLEAVRDIFGSKIKFHQISTDEVYGDIPIHENRGFTEDSPLNPSNPYAVSKAAADMFVLSYCRSFGLNATISRCSNNYGKNQFPEKLIPYSIDQVLKGNKIKLYGTGENIREWIYVDDHCKAVLNILFHGSAGQIYNVGSNHHISNLDLVVKILDILGKNHNMIEYISDRPGHDKKYSLDVSKYTTEFGCLPSQSDFDSTFKNTVIWYAEKIIGSNL